MSRKKYQVLLYPSAEQDLLDIRDYFEIVLKTSADPLFGKFLSYIPFLETDPFIYALVKDQGLRDRGYRTIAVDNFLLFFVINENQVQIRRFLYGGRNYRTFL